MSRYRPNVVHTQQSPNASSRGGVKPKLIVVHSTESDNINGSSRDLVNMAGYLSRASVQASSHVIIDADGNSARLVADGEKAWTQANLNPHCLSIEQIGRASQKSWTRDELREAARWIAFWSKKWGIPIRKGKTSGTTVLRSGVVRHSDLGAAGGSHHDPGPGYPLESVLNLAKFYRGRI